MSKQRVNTTIDGAVLEAARILAIKKGKRFNDILEEALREYLEKEGQQ